MSKSFTTISGKSYAISCDVDLSGGASVTATIQDVSGAQTLFQSTVGGNTTINYTFLAYGTSTKITFVNTAAGPRDLYLDNLSIKEVSTNGYYSQRLNGSTNEKIGLAKSLSVRAGDTIKAEVFAKYPDPDAQNWTTALQTLLGYVATPSTGPMGTVVNGTSYSSSGITPLPGVSPINHSTDTNTAPKAYLNYIFINRNFDSTSLKFDFLAISEAAKETGTDTPHERLSLTDVITEPGYVYIYLSNDNPTVQEVYFDDFKVEHIAKVEAIQTQDYYPFGLTFNEYESNSSIHNKYLFNKGAERENDLGLQIDLTKFRSYDPALGRWLQVDPKPSDAISVYASMENNPVRYNDPEGDCVPCMLLKALGNFMKGTSAGTSQRYQTEPKRGSTVTGIRDTRAPGGRTQAVVRVDKPHGSTKTPHININSKLTGAPDPHTPISGGTLKALGRAGKVIDAVSSVAKPVAVVTDAVRIGTAVQSDGGTVGPETIKTTASVAGGWAGAWAGAAAGAAAGAKLGGAIGTVVEPGGGTVVGGAVGGLLGGIGGGIAGAFGGSWLAEKTVETVINK